MFIRINSEALTLLRKLSQKENTQLFRIYQGGSCCAGTSFEIGVTKETGTKDRFSSPARERTSPETSGCADTPPAPALSDERDPVTAEGFYFLLPEESEVTELIEGFHIGTAFGYLKVDYILKE